MHWQRSSFDKRGDLRNNRCQLASCVRTSVRTTETQLRATPLHSHFVELRAFTLAAQVCPREQGGNKKCWVTLVHCWSVWHWAMKARYIGQAGGCRKRVPLYTKSSKANNHHSVPFSFFFFLQNSVSCKKFIEPNCPCFSRNYTYTTTMSAVSSLTGGYLYSTIKTLQKWTTHVNKTTSGYICPLLNRGKIVTL